MSNEKKTNKLVDIAIKHLFTAEEVSNLLRVPKRTIYKFAKEGQVPGAMRIGKHWRFQSEKIEEFLRGESPRSFNEYKKINQ